MDNAQSFNIPLDSPLEASIEHAMVPASQPTFAYNPQSPVSGLLHNSVKYEGNGIFCGQYRYDINVRHTFFIQDEGITSGVYVLWDETNPTLGRAWVSLDQDPNPDPPLAQQPYPSDILRNYYDYNGLRYAIDVKYPFTTKLKNLGFVYGYLNDNPAAGKYLGAYILPGAIHSQYGLKVLRTDQDGVISDYVTTSRQVLPGNPRDKYIISGGTGQLNKSFILSVDVFNRQLDSYIFNDSTIGSTFNGIPYTADRYVPSDYIADVIFNRDEISVSVVHETKEQDNISVVMPQLLRNDTGWDMTVRGYSYDQSTSATRFNFISEGTDRYLEVNSNGSIRAWGSELSSSLGVNGYSLVPGSVYNTPNEMYRYGIVNYASIAWPGGKQGLELEYEVDVAHIGIKGRGIYTYSISQSNLVRMGSDPSNQFLDVYIAPETNFNDYLCWGRPAGTIPSRINYPLRNDKPVWWRVGLTAGSIATVTEKHFANYLGRTTGDSTYKSKVNTLMQKSAGSYNGLFNEFNSIDTPFLVWRLDGGDDTFKRNMMRWFIRSHLNVITYEYDNIPPEGMWLIWAALWLHHCCSTFTTEQWNGFNTIMGGLMSSGTSNANWEKWTQATWCPQSMYSRASCESSFGWVMCTGSDPNSARWQVNGYSDWIHINSQSTGWPPASGPQTGPNGNTVSTTQQLVNQYRDGIQQILSVQSEWYVFQTINEGQFFIPLLEPSVGVFMANQPYATSIQLDSGSDVSYTIPAQGRSNHNNAADTSSGRINIWAGPVVPKVTVLGKAIPADQYSNVTLNARCLDVETGDWRVWIDGLSGDRPVQVKSVDMDETLTSGTVRLTFGTAFVNKIAALSSFVDSPRKDQEVGITFQYDTFRVLYIKNIIFKQSKKDTITIYQGEYPLKCKVDIVTPWDFANCAGIDNVGAIDNGVGAVLRQIIDITIQGQGPREIHRYRQGIVLSHLEPWGAWNTSVDFRSGNASAWDYASPSGWSRYFIDKVDPSTAYTVSGTTFTLSVPSVNTNTFLNGLPNRPGIIGSPMFRDTSIRYLYLRRMFMLSANGNNGPINTYRLYSASGTTDNFIMTFCPNGVTPILSNQFKLLYNNGEVSYLPEQSRYDWELSSVNDFSRILQFNDGTWADQPLNGNIVGREYVSTTESQIIGLINTALSTDDDYDPTVVEALNQVLQMVYDHVPRATIDRYIENSTIPISTRSTLSGYLNSIVDTTSRNYSVYGDVFRLIFRPSDKAEFQFLPLGIFQRSDSNIIGGTRPLNNTENIFESHSVEFSYKQRDGTVINNAKVIVYEDERPGVQTAFANEVGPTPGKAYINVEAHDIEAGTMSQLEASNPDIDFAVITQQFDTSLDTEAMYYLNQDTTIKVTSTEFQLLHKDDTATVAPDSMEPDYDRRAWVVVAKIKRNQFLGDNEEIMRFGISSAEEAVPYFYLIKPEGNGIRIWYYDLNKFNLNFVWHDNQYWLANDVQEIEAARYFNELNTVHSYNIGFNSVNRGGFSSQGFAFINEPPAAAFFVSSIRLSATRVGSYLLLGIVYDSGIHQWTVYMNANRRSVFSGYGCVGIDGTVTGGAIPMFAMNKSSGLRVAVNDKPPADDTAFNSRYMAFISGQSLVFVDPDFKNGICTSAKFAGTNFILRSLPLRFSRKLLLEHAGNKGSEGYSGIVYLPPLNIGAVSTMTTWTWATAAAGIAINSWTVDNLTEDEDFIKVEWTEEQEPNEAANALLQVGAALASTAISIGNAINEKAVAIVDTMSQRWSDDLTRKIQSARDREYSRNETISRQIALREQQDARVDDLMGSLTNSRFYNDVIKDSLATTMQVTAGLSTRPKSVAIAKARLGMSALYSVSANSNIYAGPGFTQIHFAEGSRISGSYGWAHQAEGKGVMVVPRMPPIPIPFIGPLDLNNNNVVGVNPVDGVHTADIGLIYQPNFNLGAKHLVYSYPILDMQDHVIRQSSIRPVLEYKDQELYSTDSTFSMPALKAWGSNRRVYRKQIVRWQPETIETVLYENSSIVQGVDRIFSDDHRMDMPIAVDHGYPIYATPGAFDYCIYPSSELYYTAVGEQVVAVAVRDTKILDGEPTNVVIQNKKPLVASAYSCIEVTNVINNDTLRPTVYSGDTLVLNTTGYNTIKGLQVLHGFDGYSNRIARLTGESGIDIETNNQIYTHIESGAVKTTSMYPPTTYLGKFAAVPSFDSYLHPIKVYSEYIGNMGASHENLLGYRYSLPLVHKNLSLLPAVVQTMSPYKAYVIDGVTSQVTDIRTTSPKNKSYAAYDFALYGQPYRVNAEYIARLNSATGTVALQDVVATLGLRYLGATPRVAWFYASSTNTFFTFTGSETIDKAATAFRLREAQTGTWDYVSQEVAFKALLERDVEYRRHAYKDIIRVSDGFVGLVYPPNDQIVDRFGDFEVRGMASGLILQGEKRGQVNRFVIHDYMFREHPEAGGVPGYNRWLEFENDGIQVNHGNWIRPRADQLEDFWLERDYNYEKNQTIPYPIYGWFMEPFKLATSFLGIDDNIDCQFEWEINFALTPLMKRLLKDKYMVINLAAETLIPGGAASSQVTHLKVYKDLFGRRRVDGSLVNSDHEIGYYTFRFNAMNGFGNSEKLYIWSDGCIALRSLKLMATPQTEKRASPLITRIDVTDMMEL